MIRPSAQAMEWHVLDFLRRRSRARPFWAQRDDIKDALTGLEVKGLVTTRNIGNGWIVAFLTSTSEDNQMAPVPPMLAKYIEYINNTRQQPTTPPPDDEIPF